MRINPELQHGTFKAYELGLELSMEEMNKYGNLEDFINIRTEMSSFLMNLHLSCNAGSAENTTHFLYMALENLDNVDREIQTSFENEELLRIGMVHEKIRSIKTLMIAYIKHLNIPSGSFKCK